MLPYATIDNVKSIVTEMLKNHTPGPSPVGGGALVILGPFEVALREVDGGEEWVFIDEENTPDLDEILALLNEGKKPCLHIHAYMEGSGTFEQDCLFDLTAHMVETADDGSGSGEAETREGFMFGTEDCGCAAMTGEGGGFAWQITLIGT